MLFSCQHNEKAGAGCAWHILEDMRRPVDRRDHLRQREAMNVRSPIRARALLACGALLLVTLAAYYPAWHGGLLWDDDGHITPHALRSPSGLWRIWFDPGATQQYYPLTHSAFWIQHRLWDDRTLGYHIVSIILHSFSAFVLGLILQRLEVGGAWLAAIIFAIHPVNVESVAWISELKNTLSGLFYLCAALSYLRFDADRRRQDYVSAIFLFLLALLSKTVTATLPAALIVVLWWRRGGLSLRRDALPLGPFVALGLGFGLITIWIERALIGAQGAEFQLAWLERSLVAGRAITFYLGKLLWPADLTFVYPRWTVDPGAWWQYLFPAGAAALVAVGWFLRKRSRAPFAAMLYYCATLFPALGFFNVYPFRYSFVADHFQYLAGIGIVAVASAGLVTVARKWNLRGTGIVLPLLFAGALIPLTWSQSRLYESAGTLYRATLRRNPSCWMIHGRLGDLALNSGRTGEAVAEFREALALKPDFAENHYNLANALQKAGLLGESEAQYKEALRLQPDFAQAHNNLGGALQKMGRLEEAVVEYRKALELNPGLAQAHNNLCNSLPKLGRFPEAISECREALRLEPEYADAHYNLGVILEGLGHTDEAVAQYREAVRLNPGFTEAHVAIGNSLLRTGRLDESLVQYKQALRLEPDSAALHFTVGNLLLKSDRPGDAIAEFRAALRLSPDLAQAHNSLGYALERLGRIDESLTQYRAALQLKPDYRAARENLDRVSKTKQAGGGRQ